MQLDIVIPCFNEEEVLRSTQSRLRSVLEEVKKKMARSMHVFLRGNEISGESCGAENKKIGKPPSKPNCVSSSKPNCSSSRINYLDAAIFFLSNMLFLLPH